MTLEEATVEDLVVELGNRTFGFCVATLVDSEGGKKEAVVWLAGEPGVLSFLFKSLSESFVDMPGGGKTTYYLEKMSDEEVQEKDQVQEG